MDIPSWFVIAMGLGTVFIGLICIIVLCKILGAICTLIEKGPAAPVANAPVTPAAAPAAAPVSAAQDPAKRQEIIAAIGVAIAEECGVGVEAIRIASIKKI